MIKSINQHSFNVFICKHNRRINILDGIINTLIEINASIETRSSKTSA